MEYEFRRYRITQGHLGDFVEAWRSGVVPLREKHGFVVEGAWAIEATHEFVWVLSYSGPDGFTAADRAYYESSARADLDPDPRQYIEAVETAMVAKVI